MGIQQTRLVRVFSISALALLLVAGAALLFEPALFAQSTDQPIAAARAFQTSPFHCNAHNLTDNVSPERINPEWTPIVIDPNFPPPYNAITILEGLVPPPEMPEPSGRPGEVRSFRRGHTHGPLHARLHRSSGPGSRL